MTSAELKETMGQLMAQAEAKILGMGIFTRYEHPIDDECSLIWKRGNDKAWGLYVDEVPWQSAPVQLRLAAVHVLPEFVEGLKYEDENVAENVAAAIELLRKFV